MKREEENIKGKHHRRHSIDVVSINLVAYVFIGLFALICLLPLLKLGLFTFTYRVVAAFSQPVADRRMVAVFQGSADSGKLLFQLVFMVAVLFLLTLTIIIAATN